MLSIALLLALTSAQAGTAISAGQALAAYQDLMRSAINPGGGNCPDGAAAEIVVCGRQQRPPPRLPFPEERDVGGDRRFHAGEPAGSADALAADSSIVDQRAAILPAGMNCAGSTGGIGS